jgi:hypothetical protein
MNYLKRLAAFGVLAWLLIAGKTSAQLNCVSIFPPDPTTQSEIVLYADGFWADGSWMGDSSTVTIVGTAITFEVWSHKYCGGSEQQWTFIEALDTVGVLPEGDYTVLLIERHTGCSHGGSYADSVSASFTVRSVMTIHVPSEQPTIQAGIDAAADGDTVLVAAGTYTGDGNRDIDFSGKSIVLISESGPELTTINCEGTSRDRHRGFYFHCGEDSTAVVDGFTIRGGHAPNGGGIRCDSSSSPEIINNIITENEAYGLFGSGAGGGVLCYKSSPSIIYNTISGNLSGWTGGGGIYCWESNSTISHNIISGNSGGDIMTGRIGGGIECYDSNPVVSNNTVSGNSGFVGGGIGCTSSSPTIINNTISGNSAQFGSGIYCFQSGTTISNTIIAFNSNSAGAVFCDSSDSPVLSCCDVYGNAGGDWVGDIADHASINGNFSADPLFCDTASGDFRVSSSSPCLPENNEFNELIGALGLGCSTWTNVSLDIKPGSCPNPLNARDQSGRGKAVLPAAILGTTDFDVRDVDPTSITLNGAGPVRWNYEDVGTPVDKSQDSCACSEEGPDGFEDLTLKFDRRAIISSLNPMLTNQPGTIPAQAEGFSSANDVSDNWNHPGPPLRDSYVLRVEGQLEDGSAFEGYDCVLLMKHGQPFGPATNEKPRELELIGNYPNPFNPKTRISFYLPEAAHVRIDIYNALGQRIERLKDDEMESGEHVVEWDGSSVASGVYFYRLEVEGYIESRKMLLLK